MSSFVDKFQKELHYRIEFTKWVKQDKEDHLMPRFNTFFTFGYRDKTVDLN